MAVSLPRERTTVYTLSQLHSYDWLAWNAAFAAMLLATGLGARRNAMLPAPLAWATIVIGASLLTPLGFFGFVLVPVWLIVIGLWLGRRDPLARALALAPITVCVVLLAGCGGSESSAQTVIAATGGMDDGPVLSFVNPDLGQLEGPTLEVAADRLKLLQEECAVGSDTQFFDNVLRMKSRVTP